MDQYRSNLVEYIQNVENSGGKTDEIIKVPANLLVKIR